MGRMCARIRAAPNKPRHNCALTILNGEEEEEKKGTRVRVLPAYEAVPA